MSDPSGNASSDTPLYLARGGFYDRLPMMRAKVAEAYELHMTGGRVQPHGAPSKLRRGPCKGCTTPCVVIAVLVGLLLTIVLAAVIVPVAMFSVVPLQSSDRQFDVSTTNASSSLSTTNTLTSMIIRSSTGSLTTTQTMTTSPSATATAGSITTAEVDFSSATTRIESLSTTATSSQLESMTTQGLKTTSTTEANTVTTDFTSSETTPRAAATSIETTSTAISTTKTTFVGTTEQPTTVAPTTAQPMYGCLNVSLCPMGFSGTMEISCDNITRDAQCQDGWLVILKRTNELLDFNRTWDEYKTGFGNSTSGDFWIGLELISQITNSRNSNATLLVDMVALPNSAIYIQYDFFRVAEEEANYGLYLEGYSGNVTQDSFSNITQGIAFSTFDRDNDANTGGSCALSNGGGWWYDNCARAQFTAHYSRDSICRSDLHRCLRYEGVASPGGTCGLTCMLSSAIMKIKLHV